MKKNGYNFCLLILILILNSYACENEPRHYNIWVKNNSNDTIYYAMNASYDGNCQLSGNFIPPQDSLALYAKRSWEDRLSHVNESFDFYVVSDEKFNDAGVFYDCDSIALRHDILRRDTLSLDDFKRLNFTITYP